MVTFRAFKDDLQVDWIYEGWIDRDSPITPFRQAAPGAMLEVMSSKMPKEASGLYSHHWHPITHYMGFFESAQYEGEEGLPDGFKFGGRPFHYFGGWFTLYYGAYISGNAVRAHSAFSNPVDTILLKRRLFQWAFWDAWRSEFADMRDTVNHSQLWDEKKRICMEIIIGAWRTENLWLEPQAPDVALWENELMQEYARVLSFVLRLTCKCIHQGTVAARFIRDAAMSFPLGLDFRDVIMIPLGAEIAQNYA